MLTASPKAVRSELPQRTVQASAKQEHNNFNLLLTDDESWMLYAHDHWTKEVAS
jgi:hypothetical protein